MPRPFIIGLLGGIGSGKSTVAALFREAGAVVIDADRLAHECLARPDVVAAIRAAFGAAVIDAAGAVDRPALAAAAFGSDGARRSLEAIVHPCVRARIDADLREFERPDGPTLVVLDVPLLLESDLNARCHTRVFVDAPLAERRRRVAATRGWDAAELDRREKFQSSGDAKREAAEYTIPNLGSLEPLRSHVRAITTELEKRARGSQVPPQ